MASATSGVQYGAWVRHRAEMEWVYSVSGAYANPHVYTYIRMNGSSYSNGSFVQSWSGWWGSGSVSPTLNLGPNDRVLVIQGSGGGVPLLYGSEATVQYVATTRTYMSDSGVTLNLYFPARPYLAPRPPKDVSASRVSDTQATVSWTSDYDNNNQAQPWTHINIDRWSASTNTWTRVAASLARTTTSWSDTGIVANDRYRYRLQSVNSGGSSVFAETAAFSTTPSAPIGATAQRQGVDIVVSWTNTAGYQDGSRIYDNGTLVGTVGIGETTWTHVSPSSSTSHTYTIRAFTNTPALQSVASSPSNTVTLESPPNAPTDVAFAQTPVGFSGSGTPDPVLTWKHNPTDSSQQRQYRLRWRRVGDTPWNTTSTVVTTTETTPAGVGANTIRSIIGGAWDVGQFEFQVSTWGTHATVSPWSASVFLTIENEPTVTILTPAPGATIGLSRITAMWSYAQAQSRAQARFTLELVENAAVVWTITQSSPATSFAIPHTLRDDTSYTLRLTTRSSTGINSATAVTSFDVDYLEPAIPVLVGEFNEADGSHQIAITNESLPVDTVLNRVYRCVNRSSLWMSVENDTDPADYPPVLSEEWELVGEFPNSETVSDFEGLTYGRTVYRVEAVSAIPSSAVGAVVIDAESTWVWLGVGAGFRVTGAIPYNLIIDEMDGLAFAEEHYFDGQDEPTLISGSARTRQVSVSGTLDPLGLRGATWEDLRKIARTPGTKLYRDHDGRRFYANLPDGIETNRAQRDLRHVVFTANEVTNE